MLAQTRAKARDLRLRVETLAPLDDLDTPDDVVRLIATLAFASSAVAPNSRRALAAMGLLPPR